MPCCTKFYLSMRLLRLSLMTCDRMDIQQLRLDNVDSDRTAVIGTFGTAQNNWFGQLLLGWANASLEAMIVPFTSRAVAKELIWPFRKTIKAYVNVSMLALELRSDIGYQADLQAFDHVFNSECA